jgi:hypothetical protein
MRRLWAAAALVLALTGAGCSLVDAPDPIPLPADIDLPALGVRTVPLPPNAPAARVSAESVRTEIGARAALQDETPAALVRRALPGSPARSVWVIVYRVELAKRCSRNAGGRSDSCLFLTAGAVVDDQTGAVLQRFSD